MTSPNNLPPILFSGGRDTLSRRRFLRAIGVGGASVAGAGVLAACSSGGTTSPSAAASSTPTGNLDSQPVVNFSNWPAYIDQAANNTNDHPTLDEFKKSTGITVNYTEDVNDNEQFFAIIRPMLAAGQDTGRDLFALTDWMAAKLINLGWVQLLDLSNIPNHGNIIDALAAPTWDPKRQYSMPWQSGFTGIAYNKKVVSNPVTTVNDLLTRSDLKGRITVLTEMRDTMGLIMLDQGMDPSNFTKDDWDKALGILSDAQSAGQIRQFTGNDYLKGLGTGDIAACMAWSGDIVSAENPDLVFVAPDAGLMIWADNMMIPNQAQHKANAEKLMNWYYNPKIAAQLAAFVWYISPCKGAQEEMVKIDPKLAKEPLVFPDAATLAKSHLFMGLTPAEDNAYTSQFQTVSGA